MLYDIIIIGGGISGLYSAYKILKMSPKSKILVLEAEPTLGGRAGTYSFQGVDVVTGAGVGRKQKDHVLINLLDEMGIKYSEFETSPRFSPTISAPCHLKQIFSKLRKKFDAKIHESQTFKEYATAILGQDEYKHFVICSGYTDFENQTAHDTLFYYGFEDNFDSWTGLSMSWKDLVERLKIKIGKKNIHCSRQVSKIRHTPEKIYQISCKNESVYESTRIILATTIESVRKLLPGLTSKMKLYRSIHGQPFLRIYGKFSKEASKIMRDFCPHTTVVPGPLHKIIPMNSEKGVYMIAYSDNKDAKLLENFSKNTAKNRGVLCNIIEIALGIPLGQLSLLSICDFYWEEGTHYYDPLLSEYKTRKDFVQDIQKPSDNIRIVGEMVSLNQGWVEGALESVDLVIDASWISNDK